MTMRIAFVRIALCLPLASAGCTTVSPTRDALFSRAASARDADAPSSENTTQTPTRTVSESRREPEPLAPSDAPASTPPAVARSMDAATLTLVEQELKDLPGAERQRWTEYLQTLDPKMVPYVLQARRMEAAAHGAHAAAPPATIAQTTFAQEADDALPHISPNIRPNQTFHAPQLGFQPYDESPAAVDSSQFAARTALSAPEPNGATSLSTGISPFGRNGEGIDAPGQPGLAPPNSVSPSSRTAYEQSPYGQPNMPSIAPNGPAALPAASTQPNASGATLASRNATGGLPTAPFDASQSGINPVSPPRSGAALQDAYWQETLQRLTALIEAEVAAAQPGLSESERLTYVRKQVWLRMLYLMAEQPQLAQQAIPGIDPDEQEFWTELFWAVSNYFDEQSVPGAADRVALTVDQLESAQRQLETIAPLQLRSVSFCYKINSFGNFDRYERDEFRPGQPVLLYAEVRNFRSEPAASGGYHTRLKSHIEIRRGGPDGQPVEQNTFPATEDTCRSIRHDYFHSYKIDLPQHLTPGPYALVLTVEDELSGKAAAHTVNFLVR